MFWLIIIIISFVTAAFIYSQRFISKIHILGLRLVQFYYLLVVSPLVFVSLINIGLDILNRPSLLNIILPDRLLFSLFAFTTAFAVIGNGVHATSTSVYQDFPAGSESKAYHTNELYHKQFSHNMIYLGGIATSVFLALLEFNHPNFNNVIGYQFMVIFGVILGLAEASSVIWSTYIKINFSGAIIGLLVLLFYKFFIISNLDYYPIATVMLFSLLTIVILLGTVLILPMISKKITIKMIKLFFPIGHPLKDIILAD